MQPAPFPLGWWRPRRFNPHPARRPDAAICTWIGDPDLLVFQSSPGPEAGCSDIRFQHGETSTNVSILTRPGGRMQRWLSGKEEMYKWRVSILTRPGGRMQPELPPDPCARTWFQSSPGPEAGCSSHKERLDNMLEVSILTRPGGRMQLS